MKFKVTVVIHVDAPNGASAETIVSNLLKNHSEFTGFEITYTREHKGVTPVIKNTSTITPMSFDEFSIKYTKERARAGDTTKPADLTAAYAVYCRDPDGHWLHKE